MNVPVESVYWPGSQCSMLGEILHKYYQSWKGGERRWNIHINIHVNIIIHTIGKRDKKPFSVIVPWSLVRAGFLLVDGEQQLALVHADSGVISFSWQLGVFVEEPSLPQHICCCIFGLRKEYRKSFRFYFFGNVNWRSCYLLYKMKNTFIFGSYYTAIAVNINVISSHIQPNCNCKLT